MGKDHNTPQTARTGRPTGFARADAVQAAMNFVWKKGFLAASAKELAEAMEIQRSSFYNSFGSREALFREVLAVYGAQAPDAPLRQIKSGDPVVPVMVSVLRNVCHIRATDTEARGCLVCNGVAELAGVDDEIGALLEKAVKQQVSLMERLLLQAVRQKEMPAIHDVAATAKSFVAFLIGLNILSKVVRNEKQLWASSRQFVLWLGVPKAVLS
ncbi:MAG: TetR/AcrR family transcriptional regulator [Woeseiaceae bacterium]|nr:TetR/AcrR family transcriptional regulator [Woeseiaceae bacterium]